MTTTTRPTLPCADDPEAWFSDDPAVQEACKTVCGGCAALQACQAHIRAHPEPWGVWAAQSADERAEPAAWLQPTVYAPVHGRNACYAGGCRLPECRSAHTAYVAVWRFERKWTSPPIPSAQPEQLLMFGLAEVL